MTTTIEGYGEVCVEMKYICGYLTKVSLLSDQAAESSTAPFVERSSLPPPSNYGDILEQKHAELVREAVTFQMSERVRGGKSYEDQCEPIPAQYGNNHKFDFRVGEFYRIWHPTNTGVHLSTFLVVGRTGTNMTCLKVVYRQPDQVDHRFENTHGALKVEEDLRGGRRSSSRLRAKQQPEEDGELDLFVVIRAKLQRFKENCWIDLQNPWNINWQQEYLFVYCGHLQEESFERAREIHFDLYEKLRKSTWLVGRPFLAKLHCTKLLVAFVTRFLQTQLLELIKKDWNWEHVTHMEQTKVVSTTWAILPTYLRIMRSVSFREYKMGSIAVLASDA
jgi:hypothetical protein